MAKTEVAKTGKTNVALSKADFVKTIEETTGSPDVQPTNEQIASFIQKAEYVSTSELTNLTGTYMELKDGETYVVYCRGIIKNAMKKLNGAEGEMCDAVDLVDRDGNDVINADVVLISTARKLEANNKVPCFLNIYVDGYKGQKPNEYKNLVIHRF